MIPRILLLQARTADDPMRLQELQCFVDQTGLSAEAFSLWNVCEGPPSRSELLRFDAVMVGGSGDFYVSKGNLPNFEALLELLRELVESRLPSFASCFGFQCLVKALGGEIVYDPEHTEVGTYTLELTPAGQADPLLGSLPQSFSAQEGHKDQAARLPAGTENLAGTEASALQAFRYQDAPIWATQFHPELSGEANLARYKHYLEGYASHLSEAEVQATFNRFGPSLQASGLLRRFLELVFDLKA